jgi:hypothetical protein
VLEVFPVQDWDDSKDKVGKDELPIQPISGDSDSSDRKAVEQAKPEPTDGAQLVVPPFRQFEGDNSSSQPENDDEEMPANRSRFSSTALFVGSLWILRETGKRNQRDAGSGLQTSKVAGFSRRARRRRKLQATLDNQPDINLR